MKAAVVVFLGTNCEVETKAALEKCSFECEYVDSNTKSLLNYDCVFLCGGFSYGDYIRSGRLAKFTPVIAALRDYIEKQRGVCVGICNGFQILCEAEILPGALTHNSNMKFISKNVNLEFNNNIIKLPVAHHQGNYLKTENVEVFMRYSEDVNGSDERIAGIIDKKNKVIGMMPHPERAINGLTGLYDGKIVFKEFENLL